MKAAVRERREAAMRERQAGKRVEVDAGELLELDLAVRAHSLAIAGLCRTVSLLYLRRELLLAPPRVLPARGKRPKAA